MKKKTIRLICFASSAVLLVSAVMFAGCRQIKMTDGEQTAAVAGTDKEQTTAAVNGTDGEKETDLPQETGEKETDPPQETDEKETDLPQETGEKEPSEKTGLLEYAAGDESALCRLLEHILSTHSDYTDRWVADGLPYDCASADALVYALTAMINYPYCQLMEDMDIQCGYGWADRYTGKNADVDADVIREFRGYDLQEVFYGGDSYSYIEYDGAFFDDLLRGIFNVEPDHGFVYKVEDPYKEGGEQLLLFYDSGRYYATYFDGGDGAGPIVHVSGFAPLGDGRYTVSVYYGWGNDMGAEEIAVLEATVALKDIGGDRVWSVYEIRAAH